MTGDQKLQIASAILSLGVLGLGIGVIAFSSHRDEVTPTVEAPASSIPTPEDSASNPDPLEAEGDVSAQPAEQEGWEYRSSRDAIRGGEISYAYLLSDPSFSGTAFRTRLDLQKQSGGGAKAEISVPMGFICVQVCEVPVAFDDKPDTLLFSGTTNGLRALDADGFIERVKAAREFVVEIPTSDFGAKQFRFDVQDLDW